MDLPQVLAGPILRRVDERLVAVWIALSRPATLELKVWEGRVDFDNHSDVFASSDDPPDLSDPAMQPPRPGKHTVRIGEKLHLGMLSARIPAASGRKFTADTAYSYDIRITEDNKPAMGLGELGMLQTRRIDGIELPPLGYGPRMLPSFAPPPSRLDDLKIAYGSCRRPLYDDGDALVWMDELLDRSVGDQRKRIHQLFLGGDQIYADDVGRLMMPRVIELGVELIGRDPATQVALERVKVGRVKRQGRPVDLRDRDASYVDETLDETHAAGDLPAGTECFPPGHRLNLTQRSAQFTSEDGANHLISFGEFAALYLMVWSPACWGIKATGVKVRKAGENAARDLEWLDEMGSNDRIFYTQPGFPEPNFASVRDDPLAGEPELDAPGSETAPYPLRIPEHLFGPKEKPADESGWSDGRKAKALKKRRDNRRQEIRGRLNSQRVHREFLQGLGRVQRLLANVPTYMILDDHDLTDDLFLNPLWRKRVLNIVAEGQQEPPSLGETIMTNGMIAYALFQDWGNDPRRYDQATDIHNTNLGDQLPGDLLALVPSLFPKDERGPDPVAFARMSAMFGHKLMNATTDDGRYLAVRPPLTWHFNLESPLHRVVALDNRTRRSYASEIGPPGNVSADALADQLPPPDGSDRVLIVIAPLQVLGASILDDLVSPLIYKLFDMGHARDIAHDDVSGLRLMPGTNPDALETWSLEPLAFEHLLKRLAEHRRVVLLSGDVHNSTGNLMSYWRGDEDTPARIAQFTSSGFKNVMPVYLRVLDQSAMLLQQMLRTNLGAARFGWDRPADDLVLLPRGRDLTDLVAAMRAKLLRSPVLLPPYGWLDDNAEGAEVDPELTSRLNSALPPDWRWLVRPLLDRRSDLDPGEGTNADKEYDRHRPPGIASQKLAAEAIAAQMEDPAQMLGALQQISARHQAALGRMRNARQMLFRSNFGLCRFATDGPKVTAIHEIYTEVKNAPDGPPAVMDRYMVQVAPLGPEPEPPPATLRIAAIEPQPVPAPPQP